MINAGLDQACCQGQLLWGRGFLVSQKARGAGDDLEHNFTQSERWQTDATL
jgi:hypothetical protein